MNEWQAAVQALEARIRLLEDRAAIFQIMASYGPAVDSLEGAAAGALWTDDGVYDTDGYCFNGSEEIGGLVRLEGHGGYVEAGCAHVVSLPHLVIDGDRAVATGYSRVYVRRGDRHEVVRASSNRWEFVRTTEGWKIKYRRNWRLAGGEEARALLARSMTGE